VYHLWPFYCKQKLAIDATCTTSSMSCKLRMHVLRDPWKSADARDGNRLNQEVRPEIFGARSNRSQIMQESRFDGIRSVLS
jgi:hypothetical protein